MGANVAKGSKGPASKALQKVASDKVPKTMSKELTKQIAGNTTSFLENILLSQITKFDGDFYSENGDPNLAQPIFSEFGGGISCCKIMQRKVIFEIYKTVPVLINQTFEIKRNTRGFCDVALVTTLAGNKRILFKYDKQICAVAEPDYFKITKWGEHGALIFRAGPLQYRFFFKEHTPQWKKFLVAANYKNLKEELRNMNVVVPEGVFVEKITRGVHLEYYSEEDKTNPDIIADATIVLCRTSGEIKDVYSLYWKNDANESEPFQKINLIFYMQESYHGGTEIIRIWCGPITYSFLMPTEKPGKCNNMLAWEWHNAFKDADLDVISRAQLNQIVFHHRI